jgi:hypothetical protein
MNGDNFNLFYILVKLKFYIVGLLDSPEKSPSFYLTEEFLERRVPDKKTDIMNSLKSFGITSDSEIAFDDAVILKFREMVKNKEQHKDLSEILQNFAIDSKTLESTLNKEYRSEREKYVQSILENLFQLSSNWVMHKELENKFEDYSVLDEEDVIRPEEEEKLDVLNSNTTTSFKMITALTTHYIDLLADYYFNYGGDLQLKEFWNNLEKIKLEIELRYKELFRKSGLDDDD